MRNCESSSLHGVLRTPKDSSCFYRISGIQQFLSLSPSLNFFFDPCIRVATCQRTLNTANDIAKCIISSRMLSNFLRIVESQNAYEYLFFVTVHHYFWTSANYLLCPLRQRSLMAKFRRTKQRLWTAEIPASYMTHRRRTAFIPTLSPV